MWAMRAVSALAALIALAWQAHADALIAFPCHLNKQRMGDGVRCRRVDLPRGLCSACPLRPPSPQGKFLKCWDIFDTSAPGCLPKMQEYVAANSCDKKRGQAVAALTQDANDGDARSIIDYFLYSVCEQCCDCIPMGVSADRYPQYLASHTAANPTLYTPTRGNCPAHAKYDICMVAPNITHFAHPEDPPHPYEKELPQACPMLDKWASSPASDGWQENPLTSVEPDLEAFLFLTLEKTQCATKDIWDRCYNLEAAQDHLGVPEDVPEPVPVTVTTVPEPPTPASLAPVSPSPAPTEVAIVSPVAVTPSPIAVTIAPGKVKTSPAPTVGADTLVPTDAPAEVPTEILEEISTTAAPRSELILPTEFSTTYTIGSPGQAREVATPTPGPLPACFPASATVELRSGKHISMQKLSIGDEVRVSSNEFSIVHMFSHRNPDAVARYLRITTSSGAAVTLTPGHFLFVNEALVPASSATVGDTLDGADGPTTVLNVSSVLRQGLYNPHTAVGNIVVDGITCSTYTEAFYPPAAQALLAPFRALFWSGIASENSGEFFSSLGMRH